MSNVRLNDLGISYDYSRSLVGGVNADGLRAAQPHVDAAADAFAALVRTGETAGMTEAVRWPRLGDDDPKPREAALAWGERVRPADVVVSIGIGGSYLGNRMLRDALLGPGWNELSRAARGDRPELRFAGFHLDPLEARALASSLRARAAESPLRVELLAISKSGSTTETLATTLALRAALADAPGVELGLAALTAPGSGLAKLANDVGGAVLPFPDGIGGRFSVLSPVGLVTAAATGVSCADLLEGARAARDGMLEAGGDLSRNLALLYATVHHLHGRAGRSGAVFMPYSERLRCVSEWYVQLLAESLGKASDRAGGVGPFGRTPIVAVGTTDMHAQTQLHQEGPQDKTVTTIDVAGWGEATAADRVPDLAQAGKLAGKTFAELNTLARTANEEALFASGRPSDAFVLDRLDARTLGALLTLLMASVSYEGELLKVCAYDQPGVEAYKAIMRERL